MTTGTLIIVRHGQSEYNAANIFAGWVETPLTAKGIQQARDTGAILKEHGFTPDIVYSSTLSRATDTARETLAAMGIPGMKIIEDPALLERHYGGLTGMNKKQVEEKFGPEQFKIYRRSYDQPPPAMDTTHPSHPENPASADKVIGMPPSGQCTESLKDVVDRVVPFWENELLPRLKRGENILVAAHGNSLRALSMIVERMTPDQVKEYEIANGVPIKLEITDNPHTGWDFKRTFLGDPTVAWNH